LSFIDFVNKTAAGQPVEKIPGIAFRKDGRVVSAPREYIENVDSLPFPSFEAIRNYDYTDFRYPMITSRGCPYPCTYCCVGVVSSKKWRARSPENIIEEIKAAKARFNMDKFEILDDNFTLNVDRAKKFCRLLLDNKLNLSWWCHNGIRADKIDLELAKLMKESGCTSVALGVESGDEKIFDSIKKGEKLEAIVNAVKMIKQAGMKAVGYFIIGLPGDTLEGIKKTIKFQQSLGLDHFTYGVLNPYPYTEVYDVIKKEGKMLLDIKDASHFAADLRIPFEMPAFPKADMERAYYLSKFQQTYAILDQFKEKYGRDPDRILYIDFMYDSKFVENVSKIMGKCELDVFAYQWHSDDYLKNKDAFRVNNLYIYKDVPHTFGRVGRFLKFFKDFRARKYDIAFYNVSMPKIVLPAFVVVSRPKEFYFEAQNGEKFFRLFGKEVRAALRERLARPVKTVVTRPHLIVWYPFYHLVKFSINLLYRPFTLLFGGFLYFKRGGSTIELKSDNKDKSGPGGAKDK